jgi:DNA-directed RNA polymerase delta subunit
LQGFRTAWPPVPEDATDREALRLVAQEKKKKDEEKKRAHKKMLAHDALEKRHRAQAREGLPLEASPSMEEDDDDDDDEGMEVCLGFSLEARL